MSMRSELQFETYLLDLYPTPIADPTSAKQQFSLNQMDEHIPISKINNEPVLKYANHPCNKMEEKHKMINGFEIRPNKKYSGNKFNLLDPWSENDFQITQYHKKQEKDQQKFKKISSNCLKSQQSNFTNRSSIGINNSTQRSTKQGFFHKSIQKNPLTLSKYMCQKQKTMTSRTQYEKDEKFNTVTTSTQERLKWHLQMEVMVKRRKKLTNMLKLRHFGYLKPNSNRHQNQKDKYIQKKFNFQTQNSSQKFVSASERKYKQDQVQDKMEKEKESLRNKLQTYCDSFEDSFIYTKVNIQENDKQQEKEALKEKQKQKKGNRFSFNRHKEQTNMQIEQLYSALRTYTQKNRIIQKSSISSSPSKSVDRARTEFKKQFISQMKSSNLKSNTQISPNEKNSFGIKNSLPFKKKFSSIIHNDEKRASDSSCFEWKGKEKNYPQSSVSLNMQLNKTGYTGHSIKNKLKLLQSNLTNNRSKSRGNKKGENQYVQQVCCLQKKQRQIRIKNFNI